MRLKSIGHFISEVTAPWKTYAMLAFMTGVIVHGCNNQKDNKPVENARAVNNLEKTKGI